MEDDRRDPTGPFSWKFVSYLPAFSPVQHGVESGIDGQVSERNGSFSYEIKEGETSIYDSANGLESSEEASLCTEDEDWRTADGGSMLSGDVPLHA